MSSEDLSGFDIAILDAMKSMIEVLVAKGAASRDDFATPFNIQFKKAVDMQNSDGAYVFQVLAAFCAQSEAAHAIHKARPADPV